MEQEIAEPINVYKRSRSKECQAAKYRTQAASSCSRSDVSQNEETRRSQYLTQSRPAMPSLVKETERVRSLTP